MPAGQDGWRSGKVLSVEGGRNRGTTLCEGQDFGPVIPLRNAHLYPFHGIAPS